MPSKILKQRGYNYGLRRVERRLGHASLSSGVFLVPVEIRADIGALLAASLIRKQRLKIGQPDVIRPFLRAHGDPTATTGSDPEEELLLARSVLRWGNFQI